MPLAMRPLRDQMAHCRRTPVLPSALTRSPPTFKRRQAACESLAGRLHSEYVSVGSSNARSRFSLDRLRKRVVAFKHASKNCSLPDGVIWMQNAKAPLSRGGAYTDVREHRAPNDAVQLSSFEVSIASSITSFTASATAFSSISAAVSSAGRFSG